MRIRPALPKDDDAITQLIFNAFKNHAHHAPGAEPTEHKIIQRLREKRYLTLSLVAVEGSNIVGQVSFSPIFINNKKVAWFVLAPLSVAPHRQKIGIGTKLVLAGLEYMQKLNAQGIVLLGEPRFYARFGFRSYPHLTLPDVPSEYFLALSLNSINTIPRGIVTLNSAFFEP